MARLNSFYLPADMWPSYVGDITVLSGSEARHMLTVLRTEEDQTVRLFDGQGRDGLFRVTQREKNRALLETIQLNQHQVPSHGITLAIGWGKSKRRNYLFEKAVEMKGQGVAFWQAARSQGRVPNAPKDTWKEKCIQAAKQCGNPFLPILETLPGGINDLIEFAQGFEQRYIAWESAEVSDILTPTNLSKGTTLVVIGPEGGFDKTESDTLMATGFTPVSLGDSILRWETAATYCLSLAFFAGQETS